MCCVPRRPSCTFPFRAGCADGCSLEFAQQTIANAAKGHEAQTDFAYALTVDGEVAGGLGLHPQASERRTTATLGYWLGAPYRGQGVATAAVRQALELAWSLPALSHVQRVEAVVYTRYVTGGRGCV
jgi:RimJ/RimL family protein N-acetyltransferase